jgi:hypothetical protein
MNLYLISLRISAYDEYGQLAFIHPNGSDNEVKRIAEQRFYDKLGEIKDRIANVIKGLEQAGYKSITVCNEIWLVHEHMDEL